MAGRLASRSHFDFDENLGISSGDMLDYLTYANDVRLHLSLFWSRRGVLDEGLLQCRVILLAHLLFGLIRQVKVLTSYRCAQ